MSRSGNNRPATMGLSPPPTRSLGKPPSQPLHNVVESAQRGGDMPKRDETTVAVESYLPCVWLTVGYCKVRQEPDGAKFECPSFSDDKLDLSGLCPHLGRLP